MIAFLNSVMAEVDPLLLDIGVRGKVTVSAGMVSASTGRPATAADVAQSAKGVRFVFVGESHDNPAHHQMQADVIEALVKQGRDVCVGFEMFTRDNQANLNPFSTGKWTDAQFIENADWKKQWGFKFEIYKPIFDVVKSNGLPMAALNVPRTWIRQVSQKGPDSLTDEQKKWVPGLNLKNLQHRSVFDALIGGHPSSGADNMYAGQVTWDTAMAKSALDFMGSTGNKNRVMVIVAGVGHMMYGQGINWRIHEQTGEKVVNVTCIDVEKQREVSKGLGDFIYAAPPAKS